MTLFMEILIGIVLFTLIVVPGVLKEPMTAINDYPPQIRKRCVELGLIKDTGKRFTKADLIRKGIAMVVFAVLFALVLVKFNGIHTFGRGFLVSYIIWLAIDWYDALVLDCGWFCHSRRVRIPGTEGMKEYRDYLFHIRQSCIGMALGLPACAVVGLLVTVV